MSSRDDAVELKITLLHDLLDEFEEIDMNTTDEDNSSLSDSDDTDQNHSPKRDHQSSLVKNKNCNT